MRRPAVLERAGALTPRDRIWAAIRSFGLRRVFSVAEVMALSGQRDDTALSYLGALERAGYLRADSAPVPPAHKRRRELRRFELARDSGAHAPRLAVDGEPVEQGIGRQNMWDEARRSRADFSYRDLAFTASTAKHPVAPDEAQAYCRYLKLAGYLQVATPAQKFGANRSTERLRFVRSRNTGPRAPIVTRQKQVMDGNTGAIVYDPKERPE